MREPALNASIIINQIMGDSSVLCNKLLSVQWTHKVILFA